MKLKILVWLKLLLDQCKIYIFYAFIIDEWLNPSLVSMPFWLDLAFFRILI